MHDRIWGMFNWESYLQNMTEFPRWWELSRYADATDPQIDRRRILLINPRNRACASQCSRNYPNTQAHLARIYGPNRSARSVI